MSIFINADDTLINKYYNMLFKSNERIDAYMLYVVQCENHSIHQTDLHMNNWHFIWLILSTVYISS